MAWKSASPDPQFMDWLCRDGERPTDSIISDEIIRYVRRWRDDKADGNDVLASCCLDGAIEILQKLRDEI